MKKKNLTREQRRRRQAAYSVKVAAFALAAMFLLTIFCGGGAGG